jgi:hypothetical protein
MTYAFKPQGKEQPGTYFVQGRSNAEERERLPLVGASIRFGVN